MSTDSCSSVVLVETSPPVAGCANINDKLGSTRENGQSSAARIRLRTHTGFDQLCVSQPLFPLLSWLTSTFPYLRVKTEQLLDQNIIYWSFLVSRSIDNATIERLFRQIPLHFVMKAFVNPPTEPVGHSASLGLA